MNTSKTKPLAVAFLCASTISTSAADVLDEAYEACVAVIRDALPLEDNAAVEFSPSTQQGWHSGDEFYFAFQSGTIRNSSRDNPDWLTGSMQPSASCIGSISQRTIQYVSVNGADVFGFNEGF